MSEETDISVAFLNDGQLKILGEIVQYGAGLEHILRIFTSQLLKCGNDEMRAVLSGLSYRSLCNAFMNLAEHKVGVSDDSKALRKALSDFGNKRNAVVHGLFLSIGGDPERAVAANMKWKIGVQPIDTASLALLLRDAQKVVSDLNTFSLSSLQLFPSHGKSE